jgi:phosphoglycerate dehydrogenase-like enzyme
VHADFARRVGSGVEVRVARPGALDGVEFLVAADRSLLDALGSVASLRVVQVLSAGTDWIESSVPVWAALHNARGARDTPVAEWVVGALLGAFTGLLESAREGVWREMRPVELCDACVVIVGYGSIGEAVRARLEPMGVTVVGAGRADASRLPSLLREADAVVLLAPLTDATRGMVDASFLSSMRDGAVFVNAGRGAVVDTDALLAEVSSGRLRAVLDVVDPEPLPDDHPLWRAPGTLAITPHRSGDSAEADERALDLAAEQLARYMRGEELLNEILPADR